MASEKFKTPSSTLIYLVSLFVVAAGVILVYFSIATLLQDQDSLNATAASGETGTVVGNFDEARLYKNQFIQLQEYDQVPGNEQNLALPYDPNVPNAPTNLAVTDTGLGTSLFVTWDDPEPMVDGVNIYRSSVKGQIGSKVAFVSSGEEAYYDQELTAGKTYYYIVRGVANAGSDEEESKNKEQVPGTPNDTTPPPLPTNIRLENGGDGTSVKLTWNNPTVEDFDYVKIYRSEEEGLLGKVLESNNISEEFTDTKLTAGTKYYYTLTSVDKAGNEANTELAYPSTGRDNPFIPAE